MNGLFITGTDTNVGKTFVAAAIVRSCRQNGLRVGAYKPVCSGGETDGNGGTRWPDIEILREAVGEVAGKPVPVDRICPQRFLAPLAPPAAAAKEGRTVDEALLLQGLEDWRGTASQLIVEGVGGLLCPLSPTSTVADLAKASGFPLVIVAALRLGAINHTLLTIEAARTHELPIAGVILNAIEPDDGSNQSSIAEITARGGVPVLGVITPQSEGELRLPAVIRRIDWEQLAAAHHAC